MAEAQAVKAPQVPMLGVCRLTGRVAGVRRVTGQNGSTFLTLLRLPAPDTYTSPQTVEVRGPERCGSVGEEVTVDVRIGGYGRAYAKKGENGEPGDSIRTAENVLYVV